MKPTPISRRRFAARFLFTSLAAGCVPAWLRAQPVAPAILPGDRPVIPNGVASGEVTADTALIWSRADRPARMAVEWSTVESMADARKLAGPLATADTDFTGKIALNGLPAGQRIFYRVSFESLEGKAASEPVSGQFLTASRDEQNVSFAWSGDTCGQGYGIDESRGGMLAYKAMLEKRPDFFIHSGDLIYADNPLTAERVLPNKAGIWKNLVTEEKSKVAETLAEFRGNYRYNLLDRHVRAFNAAVPMFAQWDDHEVHNNWYPGQVLKDPRYQVREVDTLLTRTRQAFWEYTPLRPDADYRLYRQIPRGPLCDVFLLDERSYRGLNSANRQEQRSPASAFLGETQLAWFKQALLASRATWKIIASDMPVGMLINDEKNTFENASNGDGPPLGRELEFADLFSFIKANRIRNTVWLTADVHHAISHYYHPDAAVFKDFDPFWEFVSGPLHAGAFGPGKLDNTFGPVVKWNSRKTSDKEGGPFNQVQFFGMVAIYGKSKALTVTHFNRDGEQLADTTLEPIG